MTNPTVGATISFKGKAEDVHDADTDEVSYRRIRVPALDRRHCDMSAFRKHPNFARFANSTMFPAVIAGALKNIGVHAGGYIRFDQLPDGVSVDSSGFLTRITITFDENATWKGTRP